jgi:hypothetical protein
VVGLRPSSQIANKYGFILDETLEGLAQKSSVAIRKGEAQFLKPKGEAEEIVVSDLDR